MVTKFMEMHKKKQFDTKYLPVIFCVIYTTKKGEYGMLKFLAKTAEKYAKATNTACMVMWLWHQPKMPTSMIKKDQFSY